MRYLYPCVLQEEEGGGFIVSFPDVPGANTCGDDRAEALVMAEARSRGRFGWSVAGWPSKAGLREWRSLTRTSLPTRPAAAHVSTG